MAKQMRKTNKNNNKRANDKTIAGRDGMGIVNIPSLLKREDFQTAQIVRTFKAYELDASGAGNVYNGSYFLLSSLPNYTQLTTLYDSYRIDAIEATFVPNVVGIANTATANHYNYTGTLVSAIDYNSAATPASLAAVTSYDTHVLHGTTTHQYKRRWVPAVRAALYDSTPSYTSGGMKQLQWIDTANAAVEHFGLLACLTDNTADSLYSVNVYITMWVSLRRAA